MFRDTGIQLGTKCSSHIRYHHLLKTFGGWRDTQLPDGTLIWTSPARDTYVTTPGSALLFPSLCAPTGALAGPTPALQSTDRAQMMPKRKRTRAQNKTLRIAAERTLNRQDREVELGWRRWEQALAMATIKDEPPPF